MASFQHANESGISHAIEDLPQIASSLNLSNSAFKPKVNYDISSFSPRDGSAFLGYSATPRDASHILDAAHRMDMSHSLQEANRNLKSELQECQHRLRNAEQRASHAESELRALQASISPNFTLIPELKDTTLTGDIDSSVEVSQISKRLPSPRLDNFLKGNGSRRPASRNGGDESDVRCENLLQVIDDLRTRLASTTQDLGQKNTAGDESDLWRFAAMREQLRWADNLALDQSKKKEAALSCLRNVIASCRKSIRLTPKHLLPEQFDTDNTSEATTEDAQQWIDCVLHAYSAVISKVLSLENRNLALEHTCEELRAAMSLQQVSKESDLRTKSIHETLLSMLKPHDDASLYPTKPFPFAKALSERETARNLSSEFLQCDARSDKTEKVIPILKRFIHKYEFMQDILEKLANNMNDQVALVDSILAEFQTLVKCNSSDSQLYPIQRSFQFIHQELMRLDECFHLMSNRHSNGHAAAGGLWKI